MTEFYALRRKRTLQFLCISKTFEGLQLKIQKSIGQWRALQSRNASPYDISIEKFMADKVRVKVTIEVVED